ncbi:MAG TPA: radical SAM protein [Syntrophales bacterium]|nr:radical SAM protein [Syntrophales bacterium]
MIVPIFLMNRGCPHRCIYCNTHLIAGKTEEPLNEDHLRQTVASYTSQGKRKDGSVEIAFYGGNFTGMAEREQIRLLEITDALMQDGMIQRVRIATRPDDLSDRTLDLLGRHHVATVEIGVQSMMNDVLAMARRGHTAEHVTDAVRRTKERGFTVGLHLMAGLPGDTEDKFSETLQKVIALRPDMVRLHPTLVFPETDLAAMYQAGEYVPLTLTDAVSLCKKALVQFERAGIPLIRLGLQETELMRAPGGILAGPFHPAFRSLVEASLFLDMATQLLREENITTGRVSFSVSPRDLSSFRGEKNGNISALTTRFNLTDIAVQSDPALERGALVLSAQGRKTLRLRRTGHF